jgi:hypothetical protein
MDSTRSLKMLVMWDLMTPLKHHPNLMARPVGKKQVLVVKECNQCQILWHVDANILRRPPSSSNRAQISDNLAFRCP